MRTNLKTIVFIIIFSLISNKVLADNIPIIVIAPGKNPQSLATVGSTVTVIDGDDLNTSSNFSLANIIDDNSTSTNMFQMGGTGANTGIQLRG